MIARDRVPLHSGLNIIDVRWRYGCCFLGTTCLLTFLMNLAIWSTVSNTAILPYDEAVWA